MRSDPRPDGAIPPLPPAASRHRVARLRLGRLGRMATTASRVGIVLFSAAVVAIMVASVLSGPIGDQVLAQDGYGKQAQDPRFASATLSGVDGPRPAARERSYWDDRSWDGEGASRPMSRRYTASNEGRRQPATVRWQAPRPAVTDGDGAPPLEAVSDALPRAGGHQAVCVRLCDGYFFPMGDITREAEVDSRTSLCAGLCPGAPTRLFVSPGVGLDMGRATAIGTGQSYASLPVAFAHTHEVGPTCTCHPDADGQAAGLSPLADFTMRSGDSIMTPIGWRVFQGADHWPYRRDDFQSIRAARNLPARTRTTLARIEDASLGRRMVAAQAGERLRPLVVTPKVRLAASLPDKPSDAPPIRPIGQDRPGGP